ncbi:unnamed protein product [Effrenium voratum]|nr:unnamed protein product [Effrenium voratum]
MGAGAGLSQPSLSAGGAAAGARDAAEAAQEGQVFAFSSSCSQSLWVPLLEKAWARLNGSYQAAERGDAAEARLCLYMCPGSVRHATLEPQPIVDSVAMARKHRDINCDLGLATKRFLHI